MKRKKKSIASDYNFDKDVLGVYNKLKSEGIDVDYLIEKGMQRMRLHEKLCRIKELVINQDHHNN